MRLRINLGNFHPVDIGQMVGAQPHTGPRVVAWAAAQQPAGDVALFGGNLLVVDQYFLC